MNGLRFLRFPIFVALGLSAVIAKAAQPTLVDYQQSSWTDTTNTHPVPTMTWQTGDIFHVFGATADSSETINTPTVTGLTFTLIDSNSLANDTRTYYWRATAASSSSGAITATGSVTTGGLAVFQYRATGGTGTAQKISNSSARTISVTRTAANSHVIMILADWVPLTDVTVDATPTGTVRVAQLHSGNATYFVVSFGDQGGTGTTAYGITNQTGTPDNSGIAVEIMGTGGGGGGIVINPVAGGGGAAARPVTLNRRAANDEEFLLRVSQ